MIHAIFFTGGKGVGYFGVQTSSVRDILVSWGDFMMLVSPFVSLAQK